ncbi:MAG: bifunctional 2-polyprenyl-6-hydroxyphenol methylase/3-demethylubiquinol 3-O-methyltransferase UbiG [Pseudomonadota bacterium]
MTAPTVDSDEIKRFDALADDWWDEAGPMAPLHKLNPVRLAYIRDHLCRHIGRSTETRVPLSKLRILDIGCGGGLLAEPLARMGASVTGIDLAPSHIQGAKRHAEAAGLKIDYRVVSIDDLLAEQAQFDLVCAMEVIEHVPDQTAFLRTAASMVVPGGGFVMATLNRTARSFALGIVAAEYVLGWLPRGTHRWSRFQRPSEAARGLRRGGLEIVDLTGVSYDPLRDRFHLTSDVSVNYMLFARSVK